MEQQVNPYEAGQAHQQGYSDPSSEMPVTAAALSALIATKFWVSLVGITMLVIIGLNLISMVFLGSNMRAGVPASMMLVWVIPLIMVVIQVVLAVRLIQYGKAIGRLQGSASNQDFERAMEVHTKFWKLTGIVIIVMFALMILTMIVGIASA